MEDLGEELEWNGHQVQKSTGCGWILGEPILPVLITRHRSEYVAALKHIDASVRAGAMDLSPLYNLLTRLIAEQMASVASEGGNSSNPSAVI